jgi:leucyl-tRNA synthetase
MREVYNPHEIEARWQARWAAARRSPIDLDHAARPFYNLMEFPYPSGEGLHVGHVFSFGGADTYGRFMRRCGYAVFQPIGFDAFGIHSENYALKVGAHPQELTPKATARFRPARLPARLNLVWVVHLAHCISPLLVRLQ